MNPRAQRLILQEARRYGVNPEVALRVAMGEGGVAFGAVGDHGTSFGPYQEHIGGALPAGKGAAFANSRAGIDLAMRGIAKATGGRGGVAGVAAAVRGFERPAAPGPEIARDMAFQLGGIPRGGGVVSSPGQFPVTGNSGASGNSPALLRQLMAGYFAQQAQQAAAGQLPDGSGLMQLAQVRQQLEAAHQTFGPTPVKGSLVKAATQSAAGGRLLPFEGSTQGVKPHLLSSISAAAREMGATKVRVTSGYRSPQHNAAVGGVAHSNHITGDAVDGDAFVPGHGWVPLGALLKANAGKYGLRSGDVPGFYHGGLDPVHVDDGLNQR